MVEKGVGWRKKSKTGRNSMCRIEWWAILWHLGTGENFSGRVVSGMSPGCSMGPKDCICPVWGLSVPVCLRITWTLFIGVDPWPHLDTKNHKHWGGTWCPYVETLQRWFKCRVRP